MERGKNSRSTRSETRTARARSEQTRCILHYKYETREKINAPQYVERELEAATRRLSGHDLIDDIHFSAILSGFLYHRFLKRLCAILFYT